MHCSADRNNKSPKHIIYFYMDLLAARCYILLLCLLCVHEAHYSCIEEFGGASGVIKTIYRCRCSCNCCAVRRDAAGRPIT